jgi:hypothetical protein
MMSLDARGKFANAMVFTSWKGRAVVRQLVIPANPKSASQEIERNAIRVAAVGQHWANIATRKLTGQTLTDKAKLIQAAPSGQAWNGYLVHSMIGAGNANYTAAVAAWTALVAGDKTSWEAAAAALTPPFLAVAQKVAGGAPGTNITAGEAWYIYQYACFFAGIHPSIPVGGTPPVYIV